MTIYTKTPDRRYDFGKMYNDRYGFTNDNPFLRLKRVIYININSTQCMQL